MALNAIIAALLKEFAEGQQILTLQESEQFEHFVNYAILSDIYAGDFNPLDISTGLHEFGLDGIAVIVNGALVDDVDEIDELVKKNKYLDVEFIFTQAKTSAGFDTGDILKTLIAVGDFFGSLSLLKGERVAAKHVLKEHIYSNATHFRRAPPKLSIFYGALGAWQDDATLTTIIKGEVGKLEGTALFSSVIFNAIGVNQIRELYFRTKNAFHREIDFEKCVTLPAIPQVKEAYIGLLPAPEYLKLITDEHGAIKKQLFFDNMRDFIVDSETNAEISGTLASDRRAEFPLRNNGVTVVARKLQRTGNRFDIEDYQIVNGCQTSHVIYNNRASVTAAIVVPIKIIVTENDDVTNTIIRGSNVSNSFDRSQLWATEPFHKDIEIFFEKRFEGEQKLFYERRKGQFAADAKIEKVRIVTPPALLKAFASMFGDKPHDVTKYYSQLEPEVGKTIFNPKHDLYVYYAAAYAAFRLESLFRNKRLKAEFKPCRQHLLMGFKYATLGEQINPSDKLAEKKLTPILAILADQARSAEIFSRLIDVAAELQAKSGIDTPRQLAKAVALRDTFRDQAPKLGLIAK